MRKYIETICNDEYEILTDNGFEDVKSISLTIPYRIWEVFTINHKLKCADTHILFDDELNEIFTKDLSIDDLIMTDNGPEKLIKINETDTEDNMVDIELCDDTKHRFYCNGILSHNSTILRYIAGLQQPTSGKVLLHGKELTENDRIPMVFQNYSSFPWLSVLENVAMPLTLKHVNKDEARDRAMDMIKIVGLEGHENKYAKYPNLSGGQLQRVAIARNLVANSTILLMDEPFGALDIVTRKSMQEFLRKIFQDNNKIDPTVILVTHDIRESIFLSTDIYILDANPANVRCHIEVDLPNVRDISLKRDPKFLEYVNYVEDFMEKLEVENEARKPKGLERKRVDDILKKPIDNGKKRGNFLFKK